MFEQRQKLFRAEILAGLLLAILGTFILVETSGLEYSADFGPGPGFLPVWLGIIITGLSLLFLFLTIRNPVTSQAAEVEASGNPLRSLVSWVAIMVAIGLVTHLGFYVSFAILTAFLVFVMERRSLPVAVAIALGCGLVFYVLFSVALGFRLPAGSWGF